MTKIQYYEGQLSSAQNIQDDLQKKLKTNSIVRLIVFLLIFVSLFGLVSIKVSLGVLIAFLLLAGFLALVKRHLALQKKASYWKQKVCLYQKELQALNGKWKSFPSGEEYTRHHHSYAYDLDITGIGSIFQYINRTVTKRGELLLVNKFMTEELNEISISNYQEAIKELSGEPDLLEHFRAVGMITPDDIADKQAFKDWLGHKSFVADNKFINYIRYVMPALLFVFLALSIGNSTFVQPTVLVFLANLILTGAFLKKINIEHHLISKRLDTLKTYRDLLQVIEEGQFKSELLSELKGKITSSGKSATSSITDLTKAVSALDNRLNMLVGVVLEGTLLWDFHCLIRIAAWKNKHSSELELWMNEIAHFDYLVTMATYTFNHPEFIFPIFDKEKPFVAVNMGHPLIPQLQRVNNDFSISSKGEFIIITGANMAGKSTFLRTVGLNMVLAMLGLPVCAGKLTLKPRKLFTSMRTSDSLSDNESYFYAELKRLKEMFDLLEKGEDIFIILDEILKGTNSLDKQKGSWAALTKVFKYEGTGLVATHDLSLTDIEKEYPEKVRNLCFEIEIDNTKIDFDYKLYNGVTQKMNALLLMKQMGIID